MRWHFGLGSRRRGLELMWVCGELGNIGMKGLRMQGLRALFFSIYYEVQLRIVA